MEGKRPILYTLIAMTLAFSAAAIIMFRVDPYQTGWLEKSLFFISFFIGLAGLIKIITFLVKIIISKVKP